MKLIYQLLFLVSLITIVTNYSYSGLSENSLNRELSAREISMANTGVADAANANAWYWNPAGLVQINGEYITSMHLRLFFGMGMPYNYMGYARSLGEYAAAGIYLARCDFTNELGYPWEESGLILSYSTLLPEYPDLYLGLNIKLLLWRIEWKDRKTGETFEEKSRGTNIDFGTIYRISDKLKLGFLLRNAYSIWRHEPSEGKSYSEKEKPQFILGASYKIDKTQTLNIDLQDIHNKPEEGNAPQIKIGYEKFLDDLIAIRVGYILSRRAEESGLYAGVGFMVGPWQIDYAYGSSHPLEEVLPSQRVSFIFEIK